MTSTGSESEGQRSVLMNDMKPVLFASAVVTVGVASTSGGRLKLKELKITCCSSCGSSWAYVPQQLPNPAM